MLLLANALFILDVPSAGEQSKGGCGGGSSGQHGRYLRPGCCIVEHLLHGQNKYSASWYADQQTP